MENQGSLFVLRLCALTRLHTDGAGALAASVGYSSSNLMSVLANRRRMPNDVADKLSAALSFSAEGFSNSGAIESWLARKVDDLLLLKRLGFELRVLCRLVTDREQGNAISVVYKFVLLEIVFGETRRFVVLRMTKSGVDALLQHPDFVHDAQDPELQNLPAIRYRKLNKLMRLQAVAPSRLAHAGNGHLPSTEVASLVGMIFQQTEEEQEAEETVATPLPLAAERMRRHRLYVAAIKEAYGLRGGRQPHVAYGLNRAGHEVPIEIHPMFADETHEQVRPAKTAEEHLIVLLEHVNGVIEVIFEGPRYLVCRAEDEGARSVKARSVAQDEFRELNARVQTPCRLRPKVAQVIK